MVYRKAFCNGDLPFFWLRLSQFSKISKEVSMKKLFTVVLAMSMVLALSAVSMAKNNTISLTANWGTTIVGLEYERRLGNFGLGFEANMLINPSNMLNAAYPFAMRTNAILRYYLDLSPQVKPYVSLAPGAFMVFIPEVDVTTSFAMFDMPMTLGVEYTPGNLRFAIEGGYELLAMAAPTGTASSGLFFVKAAAGYRF